jgi:2'-5' RNA ligase
MRHITLAFLGSVPSAKIPALLAKIPTPSFKIAPVARSDRLLFLPETSPRVIAADVQWFAEDPLIAYQQTLADWLRAQAFALEEGPPLWHVTVARAPFSKEEWKEGIGPLPLYIEAICLYESLGNLTYQPLWSFPLLPPFVEVEHTADLAFWIYGEDLAQIYLHARIALAFRFPPLLAYFGTEAPGSLEESIMALNHLIATCDAAIGCPFKAVSFHGELIQEASSLLKWEMIIDV